MHFVTVACVPLFKYFCMLVDELVLYFLVLVQALGYVLVNTVICVPVRQHLQRFSQPGPCKMKNLGPILGCVNLWRAILLQHCNTFTGMRA